MPIKASSGLEYLLNQDIFVIRYEGKIIKKSFLISIHRLANKYWQNTKIYFVYLYQLKI